jgi:hypothetical protein
MTEIRYIVARTDEQEWNGSTFIDAREAYEHAKNRSVSEDRPIHEYVVKPIEIEL